MPDETTLPVSTAPVQASPLEPDATSRQLAALGDAMRLLADSQKTLIDTFMKSTVRPVPMPANVPDVSGDPGAGGTSPAAMVDFSKLSPLQQISVGLRDAKPVGPVAARRGREPLVAPSVKEGASASATGAD